MKTQEAKILAALQKGKKITPLDALRQFDCFRLGARIFALRKAGHKITSSLTKTRTGKYVALYELEAS